MRRPEELEAHDEDSHGGEGSQLEEVVHQLQQTEPVSITPLSGQVVMCTTNSMSL